MNEYTPSTREVRDAVLMSGKPFDQIVETDDPHYGYSIYDEYVEPGSAFDRWPAAHDAEFLATVTAPPATGDERETLLTVMRESGGGWDHSDQTLDMADAILARFTVTPKNGDN